MILITAIPPKSMTVSSPFPQAPDLQSDDYLALGIATCFRREAGELEAIQILEPVPSAYLEALFQGVPTSYQCVVGTTVGAVFNSDQVASLSADQGAQLCDNFSDRVLAAARTYKSRPEAKTLVPSGTTSTDLNYSTEKKRVLNVKNVVRTEDNVRQHEYTHKQL
jgi:hypothetical protein